METSRDQGQSWEGTGVGSGAYTTSLAQGSPFSEHRDSRDRSVLSHLRHRVTATDVTEMLLLQVACWLSPACQQEASGWVHV